MKYLCGVESRKMSKKEVCWLLKEGEVSVLTLPIM